MIKSELIARIGEAHPDLRRKDVRRAVDVIFDRIARALAEGDQVQMRGFGSFSVKAIPARIRRNPKTGETVAVGATHRPRFKAGKTLRLRINNDS